MLPFPENCKNPTILLAEFKRQIEEHSKGDGDCLLLDKEISDLRRKICSYEYQGKRLARDWRGLVEYYIGIGVNTVQTSACLISCTYDWPSEEEALSIMPK